jgi:hypothetical protein
VSFGTLPSAIGSESGTPTEYFELGFLSVGTADGYQRSVRLEHNPQVWFPPDMGSQTLVGYSLNPLVTATITELQREP